MHETTVAVNNIKMLAGPILTAPRVIQDFNIRRLDILRNIKNFIKNLDGNKNHIVLFKNFQGVIDLIDFYILSIFSIDSLYFNFV